MDMAILTGLPPGARASAGSKGQGGADAGIEALLAGRALAGDAGNDASAGASGNDPFSAALQVALSRVGAGLQEEQQAQVDSAALAAQGQILPSDLLTGAEQQANFAVGVSAAGAQVQTVDPTAQLNADAMALSDQAAIQQTALVTQSGVDQQSLANAAEQDAALIAGVATQNAAGTVATAGQQAATAIQLTPEQLAQAQAAAAQQATGDAADNTASDIDPALLPNLPAQAVTQQASQTNGQQTSAATGVGVAALAQVATGVQTANQQAANDDQSQGAATDTAGLLSAVADQSATDEADRFAALMDKQQMGAPAMAASANNQSAQLVNQLSANGQANVQALNAAQTPAGPVINDLQTVTESASAQLAARTESRVEALRASLGSGPVNMEVLKLTSAGGGRAVIEVTPPNQGPIRLDLQLDGNGKANLVVDGLTDSMKARLESSAGFLRQDMAGMGLTLNLELRERNDGQAAMQFSQQFSGSNQSGGSSGSWNTGRSTADTNGLMGPVGRGQSSTSTDNGVNLYA
jgi:hypothetical protein